MINFAIDPAFLHPLVPAGTELDLWKGAALVSVVGFRFNDTRVLGFSIPGHRNFEEVNLRFHVRRRVGEEVRRAVVFIRELVPRRAIAGSEEEFVTEHYWGYTRQRDGGTIEYRVEHPSWRVWQAHDAALSGDLAMTYGAEFARALREPPRSAFVAEGSAVTVNRPVRIV